MCVCACLPTLRQDFACLLYDVLADGVLLMHPGSDDVLCDEVLSMVDIWRDAQICHGTLYAVRSERGQTGRRA